MTERRTRYYNKLHQCEVCRKSFLSSRRDAKICGAICRTKKKRMKEQRGKEFQRILKHIQTYIKTYNADRVDLVHDLLELRADVTSQLQIYDW